MLNTTTVSPKVDMHVRTPLDVVSNCHIAVQSMCGVAESASARE